MNLDPQQKKVYCHRCDKWKDIYTEIIEVEDIIECLDCLEMLGYENEVEYLFGND